MIVMKKICWILSINADGVPPFGYAGSPVRPFPTFTSKIQKELQLAFAPDYQLEFISYNVNSSEQPKADIFVYNDNDEVYMMDDMKKKGIAIPYLLFYKGEVEEIKAFIESRLGKNEESTTRSE